MGKTEKTRKYVNFTISKPTNDKLNKLSAVTLIPKARIIDQAMTLAIKEYQERYNFPADFFDDIDNPKK